MKAHSPVAPGARRLFVAGPTGRLQAILESPAEDVRAAAVVCHPHPQHGGTLHNTVVFRLARALQRAGVLTLRFNFRGVEESEGSFDEGWGEEADAAAVLDFLEDEYPRLELWGAGFSFGARTICGLAQRDERLQRVLAIALPSRILECPGVESLRPPAFFLFAGEDEFGNRADFQSRYPRAPETLETDEIPGTDHLFHGATPDLEERIYRYALRSLEPDS